MQGNLRYYSEKKSWAASRDVEFFDFIPREGPRGGRVVIDGFYVYCDWQVDVATALAEGEDFARVFGRIQVLQRDGVSRWNLPGDASRIGSYLLIGPDRYGETADTGASETNLTGTTCIYIPMSKPLVHTPDDFALPNDVFGKLLIQGVSGGSDLSLGSSVVTFDSGDYYVIADCHEEHDLQFHCVDSVKMDELTSATEGVLSISGKIHELALHARGAAGGAALTNLTDVRIDEPRGLLQTSKRTELVREYRVRRRCANNLNSTVGGEVRSDPFVTGKALAVLMSDERTSSYDGVFADRLKINLTNSVSSLRAITRTIKPRSVESMNSIAAAYGLRQVEQLSVKTDKKTKKALGDWERHYWPYLRLKAPLQKLR